MAKPTYRHTLLSIILIFVLSLAGCSIPSLPPLPAESEQPTNAPTPDDAASEPTPEEAVSPTPITLDGTLELKEAGFSIQYPQNWATQHTSTTLALASSEHALTSPSLGTDLVIQVDSTPLVQVTGRYTYELESDIQAIFDISSEVPQEAGYALSATEPITVDGKHGLQADLTSDGGAGRLIVMIAPPNVIRLLGQSEASPWKTYETAFESIVASMHFVEPPEPMPTSTPTPSTGSATQPLIINTGPPGFLLRLGGTEGPPDGRFVSTRGLEAGPDGTVYVAENAHGIWKFQPDGTLLATFGKQNDVLLDAYDVDLGPQGDVFVADYGSNTIAHFKPDGTIIKQWGEVGTAEDQFGLQSPQRIAVGADRSVYALDSQVDPNTQNTNSSILRFNGNDGSFIQRISLPSGSAPNDLAVDPAGNIYLAEPTNRSILKIDSAGTILGTFGQNINPEGFTAGAIDVDSQGNIYVATWSEGILKLSPTGELLERGGIAATEGIIPTPGQFRLPNGIAAAPGNVVWVSDNDGEYSAITALRIGAHAETSVSTTSYETRPTMPLTDTGMLSQWATSATASSSYGDDYAPDGATGPPDVNGCEDSPNAWAPATPDTLETLELTYDTPVFAKQVNIYQNHQPGFVTQIALLGENDSAITVYTGTARLESTCPHVTQVTFEAPVFRVVGVKLTIDQRRDANWSEIDAVELIGMP